MRLSSCDWGKALILAWILLLPSLAFAEKSRKPPKTIDVSKSRHQFSSFGFQSAIRTDRSLAELTGTTDFIREESMSLGFSAKSIEARFFVMGSLYSQALALLQGGDTDASVGRLRTIERELISLRPPDGTFNYLVRVRNMIETRRHPRPVLYEFLALLQPFLEDFALANGDDMTVTLQIGAWLVDYSLAAAADDKRMLGQAVTLQYFLREMNRMDAPKGIINSLTELVDISEKEEITDEDVAKIRTLVKNIQDVLG